MTRAIEAIVIGGSAGAVEALGAILPQLPAALPIPIVIVLHVASDGSPLLAEVLASRCALPVKEAEDKEPVTQGTVYLAPAGYHLLIESDRWFSLSVDELVHFSRPSIDVLFESAADTYGAGLLGVLLTGANADGARGLESIQKAGGRTIVQSPATAVAPAMPEAALRLIRPDLVLPVAEIGPTLARAGALPRRPPSEETG